MNIMLCIREDYKRDVEGDSKQIVKTKEYLTKLGLNVCINNGHINDFSSYDIIHLFDLTRVGEAYKYYKIAKEYKKPIVVSPIYWDLREYYNYKNDQDIINLWEKSKVYRKEVLQGCNLIIATSNMEKKLLINEFNVNPEKIRVIYVGVNIKEDKQIDKDFINKNKLNEEYVLCVGRITPKKNQFKLAKVCNKMGIQLVLMGKVKEKDYLNKCMGYNNVKYLGFVTEQDIYNAYKFAKVHALVSFVEKPGSSSLEAALCGCNIITTEEGTAKEYLKDMAYYCNPYDEKSIEKALIKAINKKKDNKLKEYVENNFSWNRNSVEIYEAYKSIL